eukprot:45099-Pleurochrysis_carterae.AAC.1
MARASCSDARVRVLVCAGVTLRDHLAGASPSSGWSESEWASHTRALEEDERDALRVGRRGDLVRVCEPCSAKLHPKVALERGEMLDRHEERRVVVGVGSDARRARAQKVGLDGAQRGDRRLREG